MLRTRVKVGNVTHLSDARYCAGMGVDFLGFPVGASGGLSPEQVKEIGGWISGPEFFLEPDRELAAEELNRYGLSTIQVKAHQLITAARLANCSFIVTLEPQQWHEVKNTLAHLRVLFVELTFSKALPPALLEEIKTSYPVYILVENKEQLAIASDWPVDGFSFTGSGEIKTGLKDFSVLASMLESLETG